MKGFYKTDDFCQDSIQAFYNDLTAVYPDASIHWMNGNENLPNTKKDSANGFIIKNGNATLIQQHNHTGTVYIDAIDDSAKNTVFRLLKKYRIYSIPSNTLNVSLLLVFLGLQFLFLATAENIPPLIPILLFLADIMIMIGLGYYINIHNNKPTESKLKRAQNILVLPMIMLAPSSLLLIPMIKSQKFRLLHNILSDVDMDEDEYVKRHTRSQSTDTYNRDALIKFVSHGNYQATKLLLEMGYAPNHCDNDGKSLIEIAKSNNHTGIIELLETHMAKS